eukprot:7282276-Prymnesium_polylepis.1
MFDLTGEGGGNRPTDRGRRAAARARGRGHGVSLFRLYTRFTSMQLHLDLLRSSAVQIARAHGTAAGHRPLRVTYPIMSPVSYTHLRAHETLMNL